METNKTIAIEHPSGALHHYVILPKTDIKHLGGLSAKDGEYLADMFLVINSIINNKKLKDYRVWSNGPETQAVAFLHFHLSGNE